jgi:hypothetical protein
MVILSGVHVEYESWTLIRIDHQIDGLQEIEASRKDLLSYLLIRLGLNVNPKL